MEGTGRSRSLMTLKHCIGMVEGKNRYLIRPKRYERKEPSRDSRKIYIYCEGNRREYDYFRFFRGLSSNVNIIPIPSKDGKTDPKKLMEAACADFFGTDERKAVFALDNKQKDMVWFVIDTDEWGGKIGELREYCLSSNNRAGADVWHVAQSNPCFEIWLYYHFFDKKPLAVSVAQFPSLKNFVDSMISGGFDSRKHPALIGTAIYNASANYNDQNGMPDLFSTEVYKLGKEILPFVKDVL